MIRQKFTMTSEQREKIMAASAPVPYMIIGGIAPKSPQERANAAWEALGRELGFEPYSVQPVQGEPDSFTANKVVGTKSYTTPRAVPAGMVLVDGRLYAEDTIKTALPGLAVDYAALPGDGSAQGGPKVPQLPGNWPEDSSHENGDYECRCVHCGNTFYGHKRRVTCKWCATTGQVPESLLRKPGQLPLGCYCKPGRCLAPVTMGRQTSCRDPVKAAMKATPSPSTQGG